ncbi:MAG: porin [Planctomycetota bacterium]
MEFKVTSFLGYSYDLTDGAQDKNSFEISRFYLYWLGSLKDDWKFRATLDAGIRNADSADTDRKDFKVLLKHGYIAYTGFKDVEITFGQADLPFVPFWEGKYGRRYQGPIFVDREGYITSTDLGIGVKGNFFEKFMEYHLTFVNSEGWTTPEANKYKSFDGRITLNPFKEGFLKKLGMHTYWEIGNYDRAQNRLRLIGGITYEYGAFSVGGHYFWAKDPADRMEKKQKVLTLIANGAEEQVATGYTIYAVYNFKDLGVDNLSLLARWDWLDPSGRLAKDSHWRLIIGPEWKFTDNIRALLNFERVQYKSTARGAGDKDSSLLRLDVELKF